VIVIVIVIATATSTEVVESPHSEVDLSHSEVALTQLALQLANPQNYLSAAFLQGVSAGYPLVQSPALWP
jgi:hypothetical protein